MPKLTVMGLFNKLLKRNKKTVNRAGGEAYVLTPKMKLASMLLTSFAQDQYYRSANQTFTELTKLLALTDPKFAAKAAIYARTKFGMRSITHVLAAELAAYASGQEWSKDFYNQIVYRPDDMNEIIAYYLAKGGKTLPNAMKKGFARSFDRFDAYQLAKYRGENKTVKLIDIVNMVHPKPTKRNATALKQLVAGTLRSKTTWEAKLTEAGQKAENKKDKAELKAKAWTELVKERKIGYFALLRNLRNIAEQAPELLTDVCKMLTDRKLIKKSLVLPLRYISAMDAINEATIKNKRPLITALNKAIDISMDNVPVFKGRTLVVLDDSGSMTWSKSKYNGKTPIEIGALFASILFKSNDADLMRFSDNASYVKFNHGDATMSIAERLVKRAKSGGTNFHAIFNTAKEAYDRVIILSDMQGWIGGYAPTKAFTNYKTRTKANPYIYSFDLQGLGTLQFPESRVFCMTGFSDKVFDIMSLLETDRRALVKEIDKIKFS